MSSPAVHRAHERLGERDEESLGFPLSEGGENAAGPVSFEDTWHRRPQERP